MTARLHSLMDIAQRDFARRNLVHGVKARRLIANGG